MLENLKFIRIKSSKYNLLVMRDYMPNIGEVDGDVTFEGEDGVREFLNIKGFYMHKKNEFELLIKEVKPTVKTEEAEIAPASGEVDDGN